MLIHIILLPNKFTMNITSSKLKSLKYSVANFLNSRVFSADLIVGSFLSPNFKFSLYLIGYLDFHHPTWIHFHQRL